VAAIAIDSKEKRLSMLNFGLPWWTTLPEADGAIDADDRRHLLGLYSGVIEAGPLFSAVAVRRSTTEATSIRRSTTDATSVRRPSSN